MMCVNIASLTGQLIYGILYLTRLYLLNLLIVLSLVRIITVNTKILFLMFDLRSREQAITARSQNGDSKTIIIFDVRIAR